MKLTKTKARKKRKQRIKKKIFGTADRPRLVVFRSNKYIYAQLVDDERGMTIGAASSLSRAEAKPLNKETAKTVGQQIAAKAKEQNIESVVFDRNGYYYHGRVQELADAAREGGLKF
jgi:large subunit ribosomal protein L18